MTVEDKLSIAEQALANQGVPKASISDGHSGTGNKVPPAPSNKPPMPSETGPEPKIKDPVNPDANKTDETKAKEAEAAAALEAEAAKPDDVIEDNSWQDEYVEIDDPSASAAINMLKEAEVTPVEANAIFEKAIQSGKVEDVDWATLTLKVGKDKAHLIKAGITDYFERTVANNVATTKAVYEALDGESNWIKVKTWVQAQEKRDPSGTVAKAAQNARRAIDIGGDAAVDAATRLRKLYESAPTNKGLGTKAIVSGTGTPEPVVQGAPLNRTDYLKALNEVHSRRHNPAEIKALDARRKAGMAAGI